MAWLKACFYYSLLCCFLLFKASDIVRSINKCMHGSIKNQRRRTEIPTLIQDMPDGGGRSTPSKSGEDSSRLYHRRKSDGGLHSAKGEESPLQVCERLF